MLNFRLIVPIFSRFLGKSNLGINSSSHRYTSTMASQYIKSKINSDAILKSAEDKRTYEGLELNNGMKVLLISDPETDKASGAMDVNIGHMKDPVDLPGLAHFCEHMLFLGTKKYEQENEYSKFLSEHGGSSNAYTSGEHTNFYFDISPEHLPGALDRFSQFFLCPLFTETATDREVNAVNSENDKNLQSDPWRIHQLEKTLTDPSHDYSKFGTGNKDTLDTIPKSNGVNVRDALLKFHDGYYSSNIMGLCVLGKESIEELTEMVVPLIANVENMNVVVPEWKDHPVGPAQMKKIAYTVPVKDVRNLSMSWPIMDLHPYFKCNPGHYLGHLVGHEGKGSLLSELKNRGWVNTLCGGQSPGAKGFMFFKVDVDLTEEGQEHIDDIITLTYQYFNMLKREGPKQWIFDECKDLSAMTFRFKGKEKPRNYTTQVAGLIHKYSLSEVLSGPYLMSEFQPDLITMVLDKLQPDRMRIFVVSKKFEDKTNIKEKWYGTDYSVEDIQESKIQMWSKCGENENLTLPEKNDFIPTDFELVTREVDPASLPELIKDSAMTQLWFKQDDTYLLPKACINFELISSLGRSDPVNCNLMYLFVSLFKDALNEYAYDAELAGLHYGLECTIYGMSFAIGGYNQKQKVLLAKILEKMTTFKVDPKRFEIYKEMYTRSLKNFSAEQPHQHAIYYTSVLMSEFMWTKDELLQCVDEMTVEKLDAFIPQLLSKLYIEGLIYGNVTKQIALDIVETVESILTTKCNTKPLLPSQTKRLRELQLPDGSSFVYHEKNHVHKSSSIEVYYQCGLQQTQPNMLLEMFVQIIAEPCFDILRTKEQLGYIVFSGVRRSNGVQGLRVIIQSDRSPEYVEKRVEAFLNSMDDYIKEMTDEAFQKHLKALVSKRMEKPKKISGQNSRYWSEILSQQYNFDRETVEVEFLKTVKKEDVFSFFKDRIAVGAPYRKKFSIHVVSSVNGEKELTETNGEKQTTETTEDGNNLLPSPELPPPMVVTSVAEFKRDMGLYPLPRPYIDLQKARSKL
ncbi:insulin-degrading enzyme-like isoform X1 [Mytilus galloprovincialis]|uniref:insulin-degrading enzyme-like isoform X1 n=2 Tax=Mytilus galloprovincialis TaxID=29158 RepID=UPI003F7CADCE